ncbi:hypothetical protein [Pseudomonas kulmbachensis]|uniref:hypothetical protein n=1 Tax=Pseudomonas kulmbachensis TaxID=3043408 RepID=UPI002AB057D8|nr:hypothetical protein [Pseudomonas sp. FLM 004-28]
MKSDHSLCQKSSRTHGQVVSLINRLLLCESVSILLITTMQFAPYWLVLGAMMTNTDRRLENHESFILDEILSLLDGYVCSSKIPSELVVFGDFLTPQEA